MMAIFSFKRGCPRDGGLAGVGVGGMYAWRVGEADRAGHYDVKFGGQAVADESKRGFEAGRKDEEDIGISFLNCNIASLTTQRTVISVKNDKGELIASSQALAYIKQPEKIK
jgi:hypothetical protein